MSEAAVNAALRRMGYDTKTEITGHGFRAMARTILHEELHIKPEVIEHQLAHAVPDALGTRTTGPSSLKETGHDAPVGGLPGQAQGGGAEVIAITTAA
jgi:integrase